MQEHSKGINQYDWTDSFKHFTLYRQFHIPAASDFLNYRFATLSRLVFCNLNHCFPNSPSIFLAWFKLFLRLMETIS